MDSFQFVQQHHDLQTAYAGHHIPGLVVLSLVMAMLASFVSLLHTRLIEGVTTSWQRHMWHASGAVAMGLGVWAMHFIGMVSFRIDVPIYYSPVITFISVIPAIFAAWVTLLVFYKGEHAWSSIALGGLMMGAGIGGMHYTGMSAIQTQATMLYLPGMFVLSVVVAVALASVALASRRLLRPVIANANVRLIICAMIMGIAVASMHFTAMHATVFLPDGGNAGAGSSGASANLIVSGTLIVAMFIVLISTVVVIMVNRQQKLELTAEARGEEVKALTERMQSVAKRVPGMVYQLHQDHSGLLSFRYLSDAVNELFDVSVQQAMSDASAVLEKVPHTSRQRIFQTLQRSAEALTPWSHEFPVDIEEAQVKWLSATAMPERETDGTVSWNGFISDITEKRKSEETIKRLAYYDTLTELPNRRFLLKELATKLSELVLTKHSLLLMSINLDGFKRINDVHGQVQGDALLKESARRIEASLPADTVLARITADEFVAFIAFETQQQAEQSIEPVANRVLESLVQPFALPQLRHKGTASVGTVMVNDDVDGSEELLRRADLAAHQAKQEGGNRWFLYQVCIEKEISARFALEHDLRLAIEEDQFELYYQLQADAQGQFFGAEALLRWHHPERGLVSPAEFIPVAEDSGLIVPIGEQVMQLAIQQLASWQHSEKTRHLTLSINVSAKQFYQHNFVEGVLNQVASAGVPFNLVKLELTESLILEDLNVVIQKMQVLKKAGIRFSMDDFGTGYSSLSYLSQLPFDEVKIDQAFIRRASSATHQRDWTIVQAIINIARDFTMEVIAEGVETQAQQQLLQASGCERYQGYLFAKPVPASELPF